MSTTFLAAGWDFDGVEHGFASEGVAVAPHLRVVRANQVHGPQLLVVDDSTPSPAGDADGLLTATQGIAVAIATADCVPVLLAAPHARVVAAVHAGWRGTLAGIVPSAIHAFSERFGIAAADVHAALGPSIGGCCYEVERDIAQRFADEYGSAMWGAWEEGPSGRGTLDLRSVNEMLLQAAGVPTSTTMRVGPCTGCGGADLASYRVQGAGAGRQLSWIGLPG